jgi:hypothetical protein
MPDSKITALTSIGASTDPANDPLVLVDVSDTSMAATGTTKKVTLNQLLGASGTATLASATISGDLTVDTSTLKVDSANNRVGIGTASPSYTIQVLGTSGSVADLCGSGVAGQQTLLRLRTATGNTNGLLIQGNVSNDEIFFNNFYNAALVFGVNNTEGMRLNSTGLGVGVSPSYKVHSVVTSGFAGAFKSSTAVAGGILAGNSVADLIVGVDASGNGRVTADTSKYLGLGSGGINDRFILDSSGNVGVGRTPSARLDTQGSTSDSSAYAFFARNSAGNVLCFVRNDGRFVVGNGTTDNFYVEASGNVGVGVTPSAKLDVYQATLGTAYFRGGYSARQLTLTATSDGVNDGAVHTFLIGSSAGQYKFSNSSGTLMSLDASGNLLIKKTSASGTTLGVELLATGQINGATAGADNLNIYNTTAAAYRFYVSAAGTIFATNTTISAISDARFKENVEDIDVGLGAILALKPRKFDWKAGKGKDIKGDRGFIAQEFEQVFPDLIDTWKDPAPEGEAPYKSVRQDLIPVLVKAIQELTARVQTLEAK